MAMGAIYAALRVSRVQPIEKYGVQIWLVCQFPAAGGHPSAVRRQKAPRLSSQTKTFANVGAGVLSLPYTFMRTGCLTSLVTVFLVAALTYDCMMLLIHTRRKLEDSAACAFTKISSFGDLGLAVCGPIARFIVDALIVLSQAGFCIGIPYLHRQHAHQPFRLFLRRKPYNFRTSRLKL
ncbi:amino acid transporter family protein [Striga asiatica]|uniref:Amino acid transporter family protein n=1 Tax=Striga asiatica TaxID=4170 RepID=A0A5A7QK62_STRAF|nr:amino acid transporter family protein [Striga asiatica]